MDPTAPRNVAATTVASATDSQGSAAVPRATRVIGEWCGVPEKVGREDWQEVGAARLIRHGARCRDECPVGSFGQDCNGTCDCSPGARCFPANGACLCEHGFTGHRCTERLCPDGLYGLSCQAACTCDPEHSLRWASGPGRGVGTVPSSRPQGPC